MEKNYRLTISVTGNDKRKVVATAYEELIKEAKLIGFSIPRLESNPTKSVPVRYIFNIEWRDGKGNKYNVRDMSEQYIVNCIQYLSHHNYDDAAAVFIGEFERRSLGRDQRYPAFWEQVILAYSKYPSNPMLSVEVLQLPVRTDL